MVNAPHSRAGTLSLLDECERSFTEEKPEKGEVIWNKFLLGCFNSMLIPQLEDNNFQGLIATPSLGELDISSLVILSEGARLIRKIFIRQGQGVVSILPYLLPSLPSGRLIDVPLEGGGRISLEWTKSLFDR